LKAQQFFSDALHFPRQNLKQPGNKYTDDQLVSFALAGMNSTQNTKRKTAL
jgi:hypothetical protein